MTKLEKDFEFLKRIFKKFFDRNEIKSKLNQFDELSITGWEIWLQVELMIYLNSLPDEVSEFSREIRYDLDKRKNKLRDCCAIDLLIRQKKAHSPIPIEIKQHRSASKCIRRMLSDIEKYDQIRESNRPTDRFLWCLGIHSKVEDETIRKYLRDFDSKFVFTYPIPKTEFMITLF